jgi:hypothetical protein
MYVLTGQRILCGEQLLGRALEHHLAALRAAFGAHIDNPVRILDHAGLDRLETPTGDWSLANAWRRSDGYR